MARTLEVVGEKWALLVVREVFLGNRRFDEMVRRTGAPRDTLARLRTLVEGGILERRQYSDHPTRYEYFLTEAGLDLYPVIVTLREWGDQHLAGPEGPPAVFEHRCGHPLFSHLVCDTCGEPLRGDERTLSAVSPRQKPVGRRRPIRPRPGSRDHGLRTTSSHSSVLPVPSGRTTLRSWR